MVSGNYFVIISARMVQMQCEQEIPCMTTIKVTLGIAATQWGRAVNGGNNVELRTNAWSRTRRLTTYQGWIQQSIWHSDQQRWKTKREEHDKLLPIGDPKCDRMVTKTWPKQKKWSLNCKSIPRASPLPPLDWDMEVAHHSAPGRVFSWPQEI